MKKLLLLLFLLLTISINSSVFAQYSHGYRIAPAIGSSGSIYVNDGCSIPYTTDFKYISGPCLKSTYGNGDFVARLLINLSGAYGPCAQAQNTSVANIMLIMGVGNSRLACANSRTQQFKVTVSFTPRVSIYIPGVGENVTIGSTIVQEYSSYEF